MEVGLVSFATRNFYSNQKRLASSAMQIGIKKLFLWKYSSLLFQSVFWKNLKVFRSKRGAGYWAWHAIVIRSTLDKMMENDAVVFCDAGLKFIKEIDSVLPLLNDTHLLLFSAGGFQNKQYTKKDTFILMGCDEPKYWDGQQVMGGFHVWKKCPESYQLLDEYEKYCLDYQIVSDAPSMLGNNFPEFKDHRHPQSILSILAVKYQYNVLPFPVFYEANSKPQLNGKGNSHLFLETNREMKYSFLNNFLKRTGLWY